MQRRIVVVLAILALSVSAMAGCKKKTEEQAPAPAPATSTATPPAETAPATTPPPAAAGNGEALFKQQCAACHPDGGNPMNPKKTLHAADMKANNVNTADDVVKLMRNPGPGMTKFDQNTVSDSDAKAIADYVMTTYNK